MPTNNRLKNCDFVKCILMICVVIYHSILYWNGTWGHDIVELNTESNGLNLLGQWLNTFHIYAFTLISGYIFTYIKLQKGGYNNFNAFVKTKFLRLIVPFIFVCVVWAIPVGVYYFNYDFRDIFYRYILATAPNQLWFLLMLFNAFIISYFMIGFWQKHNFLGLISVIILHVIGLVLPSHFMIAKALRFLIFFYLGFYLRHKENSVFWKIPSAIYLMLSIGVFVVTRLLYLVGSSPILEILFYGVNIILQCICSVSMFILLVRLADKINWTNKVFMFISNKSMIIYMFHQQFIYFTLCSFTGLSNPWLHSLINFIFSMGMSLIFALILKRFKITRFLIGEKI